MDLIKRLNGNMTDYQGIPFWSWNDDLKPEELRRQIRQMKESGIGGFFMHARGGLITEYLGEDWFECVAACIDEAKKQGMNAWCYDENGWPSGFAGMKLLKDKNNLAHYLAHEIKPEFDKDATYVYIVKDNKLQKISAECGAKEYICVYDKQNSSVVDILNPDVVQQFIDETHEKYYARFKESFGDAMMGFFTDEPQYFRWDTPYSPVIAQEFTRLYNQDITEGLGYLFCDCEGAYEFRFRYWRNMNRLFTQNFIKRIYEWCEEHNCKITGHAIEESSLGTQMMCCAGVMPFYEYEHIPGIDKLGRSVETELAPRQVSSVAQQLGKKHVITETFACTGWDVLPMELKRIAEWQYVNGVNQTCQHLMPYSIRGQRKRDYPHHFSEHTPWFSEYKQFNDYFTRLGYMLSNSQEQVNVGIIHPIHSVYLKYSRTDYTATAADINTPLFELIEKLGAAHIPHHYIDECLLERHGSVNGNKLKMGLCEYDMIIIPYSLTLDSSTVKLLKEYIANGGKIYLFRDKPMYIDGAQADMSWLESNITYEQLFHNEFKVDNTATEVRATYRKSDFGNFIFATNLSGGKGYDLTYTVKAKGAKLFDIEKMEYRELYFEKDGDFINIPLHFDLYQSYIIVLDDNAVSASKTCEKQLVMSLDTNFKIKRNTKNSLTLDYASLSYDNINFDEKYPIMALSDKLMSERQNRTVFLKYTFEVREIPGSIFAEAENENYKNIWLNGRSIVLDQPGELDRSFISGDISAYVKPGINEIVFELDYYQSEQVYYVMYDCKDGTESLRNCLTFDTNIEAIYIRGDFTVKSDKEYTFPPRKNIIVCDGDFYIASPVDRVNAQSIPTDGFIFFSGEMLLEKEFETQDTDLTLKLEGRYSFCEVLVNGKSVKKMMFDNQCDLSGYLVKGKNTLTLRVINSNRNLLGPFHVKNDHEPYGVGPSSFDRYKTWTGPNAPSYRHDYSFVSFGFEKIELYK